MLLLLSPTTHSFFFILQNPIFYTTPCKPSSPVLHYISPSNLMKKISLQSTILNTILHTIITPFLTKNNTTFQPFLLLQTKPHKPHKLHYCLQIKNSTTNTLHFHLLQHNIISPLKTCYFTIFT